MLLAILTLLAVLWYAWEARRSANAGIEQSEALQKPCIVILQPPDTSEDAVLEEMTSSVLGEPNVRIKNIGYGPATNIRFRFRALSKASGPLEMQTAPQAAPLAHGDVADTNYPVTALDPSRQELVIDYASLSGTRYRTRAVIEDRRWVRDFQFSKITGRELDPPNVPPPAKSSEII
jgi:hypothetical protein